MTILRRTEVCYRIIRSVGGDIILALADSSLVGSKFEEGELILDIRESFYKDKTTALPDQELEQEIKAATIINAVGHKSVKFLADAGLVDMDRVLYVKGVPHAQVIRMQ